MEGDERRAFTDPRSWLAVLAALLGAYTVMRTVRQASRPRPGQSQERKPRVLVLGGGFAELLAV